MVLISDVTTAISPFEPCDQERLRTLINIAVRLLDDFTRYMKEPDSKVGRLTILEMVECSSQSFSYFLKGIVTAGPELPLHFQKLLNKFPEAYQDVVLAYVVSFVFEKSHTQMECNVLTRCVFRDVFNMIPDEVDIQRIKRLTRVLAELSVETHAIVNYLEQVEISKFQNVLSDLLNETKKKQLGLLPRQLIDDLMWLVDMAMKKEKKPSARKSVSVCVPSPSPSRQVDDTVNLSTADALMGFVFEDLEKIMMCGVREKRKLCDPSPNSTKVHWEEDTKRKKEEWTPQQLEALDQGVKTFGNSYTEIIAKFPILNKFSLQQIQRKLSQAQKPDPKKRIQSQHQEFGKSFQQLVRENK